MSIHGKNILSNPPLTGGSGPPKKKVEPIFSAPIVLDGDRLWTDRQEWIA